MLIAENLACLRAERVIFTQLGFCLQEGALLLLKGPNGSGKTSLIRMIAGLLPASEGQLLWQGEPAWGNPLFKREMMMIGHKSAVKLDLTVEENLRFWGRMYGTEMLLPAALKFFDLTRYRETYCKELSAGWQRRVALARLIIAPCRLWLLDEPTNFLDEEAVMLTASLIESRVKQGGIVISASHIMGSAVASHTLMLGDFVIPPERRGLVSDTDQTPQQVRG